jgi:hypothetical protein
VAEGEGIGGGGVMVGAVTVGVGSITTGVGVAGLQATSRISKQKKKKNIINCCLIKKSLQRMLVPTWQ